MRIKCNPQKIDVGPNYAQVCIGERSLHLRKPFASEAAELLRWTFDTEQIAQTEMKNRLDAVDADEPAAQWAILRDSNRYIEALRGRLIGSVWAHEELELECLDDTHPTPEALGLAVYAELHRDNWSSEEIDALHSAIVEMLLKLGSQRYNAKNVEHILSFGDAPREDKSLTCIAISDCDTGETRGA